MMNLTLNGHLAVTSNCMKLNDGENWKQETMHSFKHRFTVYLSTLNILKLVNFMVDRELEIFSLMNAEEYINPERQVTISSTPRASTCCGTIQYKNTRETYKSKI